MSIESILERIAVSAERSELLLGKILDKIDDLPDIAAAAEPFGTASQEPPAVIGKIEIVTEDGKTTVDAYAAPAPAPAAFVPPPAAPAPAAEMPFTDQAGLIKYGMEKYRALGAAKGGMIQNVIVDMGFNNLSKIPSERWAEFVAKCEAL
jgi:hypothetical protein